jgi:hypothetical protein
MSDVDYPACLANLETALREADAKLADAQRWRDSLAEHIEALKARLSSSPSLPNQE